MCDIVVVVVVRSRPRAIPLAMITMRKAVDGFSISMGLRLAALRAARPPLLLRRGDRHFKVIFQVYNPFTAPAVFTRYIDPNIAIKGIVSKHNKM